MLTRQEFIDIYTKAYGYTAASASENELVKKFGKHVKTITLHEDEAVCTTIVGKKTYIMTLRLKEG